MPAVTVPGTNQTSLFVTYDCEDSSSTLIKVITVRLQSAAGYGGLQSAAATSCTDATNPFFMLYRLACIG